MHENASSGVPMHEQPVTSIFSRRVEDLAYHEHIDSIAFALTTCKLMLLWVTLQELHHHILWQCLLEASWLAAAAICLMQSG